jgi:hypothetical protein
MQSRRTFPPVRKAQRSSSNVIASGCMRSVAEKVTAFVTRPSLTAPSSCFSNIQAQASNCRLARLKPMNRLSHW